MEYPDVDHRAIFVINVDSVEFVQHIEPISHNTEDRMLAIECGQVIIGQGYEELGQTGQYI